MGQDIARDFDYGLSIVPVDHTATVTGEEISLVGVLDPLVAVAVDVGAVAIADASNYFTFTVTQATATGGTFVAADSVQYDPVDDWDRIINATTEGSTYYVFNFRLKPNYDFIKVVATETATAQATFGAVVWKKKRHNPASS